MTEDINLRFEHLKEKMIDPKFQKIRDCLMKWGIGFLTIQLIKN